MKRLTPLNVAAALVVTGLLAAAVASANGAGAVPAAAKRPAAAKAGTFRRTLAAKLGEQLHKPADQVLAALKSAAKPRRAGRPADRLSRRADRLAARLERLRARVKAAHGRAGKTARRTQAAKQAHAARDAWAAALARPLGVSPADVTAALRALIAQRLDSLVRDGWLTAERRDARLACYDDAARCQGAGRGVGLGFLRADL